MVVRDRDSEDVEWPDNTEAIVGSDGEFLAQTMGRMVTREGVVAEDADWDIEDHDLASDGNYVADPENIGGTSVINLFITSEQEREFSVKFRILSENGEELGVIEPPEFQERTKVDNKGGVYSDRMEIVVEDESGANTNIINGSINIHSGGASSVKLLNPEGETVDPVFDASVDELNVELGELSEDLDDLLTATLDSDVIKESAPEDEGDGNEDIAILETDHKPYITLMLEAEVGEDSELESGDEIELGVVPVMEVTDDPELTPEPHDTITLELVSFDGELTSNVVVEYPFLSVGGLILGRAEDVDLEDVEIEISSSATR